ncbi:hypothetical protein EHQ92_06925 [Leptospira biflexa]|uniref:hypothetical protein n=1 Tax=Leptospira biflexa TaxID=172 RepID=UPI0010826566|nr:hypothetical protein [Leptospira biflexa]TGM38103.1 hypothetical protein EHQ80_11110 [Leptospira biflexa]TGM41434.1 hypothetical protein EHQ89_05675 [Leptospira biflexa]TGM47638.1 hypothetical protein EHQ92_06925 [Leptospira biflexa]TGM49896.1 hypothetical protein EHQ88_06160 [Leptospira biflexa]
MEKLFFPITNEDDYVYVDELPNDELYSHWKEKGLTPGIPWEMGGLLESVTLVEWGNRHNWDAGELRIDPLQEETSRYLNSKVTQLDFRKNHSPLKAKLISSEERLFAELEESKLPVVLKSEYGLAGRNHIIFKSPSDSWKLAQINKRLFGFPLVCEEWVGDFRFFDFSTLWDVTDGDFFYLTSTTMWIDPEGGFRGIRIGGGENEYEPLFLPKVYDLIKDLNNLVPKEYSGPCAIDGFLYSENGHTVVQPVSEFNFRYSIGRILWEVRKKRKTKPEIVSGLLVLPYPKQGKLKEWSVIEKLETELSTELILLTPVRDLIGKAYQNAVLYFETTAETESTVVTSIWSAWTDPI